MPEIKPDPEDPQKINIKAEVKELNRQMINFNVGYSGYDGWFAAVGYSTQNFLGMGETFAINLQTGTRSKNYRLAFTEPYLFNLPASLGFDVFKTTFKYYWMYTRHGEGFNLATSARFWKYWGTSLIYSFENIEITDINEDYEEYLYSFYLDYFVEGKRTISTLSPTIYYSTVDSPIYPTSGVKYLVNYRYSGGFLGGDIYLHNLRLEFVKFQPLWKNHVLGFHAVYERIKPFGGKEIPFYYRIYLGGERSIRGFDIYRIGPKTEEGLIYGGDKAFFANVEYTIPLNPQFSVVLFYDIGNAYDIDQPISFKNVYQSMGLEFKILVPMLNVPFRLIFAYNPRTIRDEDSHFAFRVGVGPSFY
jgi:outer membrane protein insertion porin family